MFNIKKAKKIITLLMSMVLIFMLTGTANAEDIKITNEEIEDTVHHTNSSQELDDGIIPVSEKYIFNESDYTNEWTAAIPTITAVKGNICPDEKSSLVETKSDDDDYNSNPPTAEDTTLPDSTYFHMYYATYTDYMYSPSGSGLYGGNLGVDFDADIVSDSTVQALARGVKIYIYDYDAGSYLEIKSYAAAMSFDDSFWVSSLNADHRYFFRVKKINIIANWWNKLDGYIRVSN